MHVQSLERLADTHRDVVLSVYLVSGRVFHTLLFGLVLVFCHARVVLRRLKNESSIQCGLNRCMLDLRRVLVGTPGTQSTHGAHSTTHLDYRRYAMLIDTVSSTGLLVFRVLVLPRRVVR